MFVASCNNYFCASNEIMDACTSSRVRPLVSGTSFVMNTIVKPHTLANTKNVPDTNRFRTRNHHLKNHQLERRRGQLNSPAELHCARKLNEYVTIQEPNQFTRVTRLPAKPFVFIGNIWNFKAMRYQEFLKFSGMIGIIFTSDIITQGIAPMPKAKHPLNI